MHVENSETETAGACQTEATQQMAGKTVHCSCSTDLESGSARSMSCVCPGNVIKYDIPKSDSHDAQPLCGARQPLCLKA